MSEELMSLATQCLDICQELESKGKAFTFNLTITSSNFSFSLDTKKNGKTKEAPMKKKQPSPSTVRRNLKRKQEFLKKKEAPESSSVINTDLEEISPNNITYKCNQCENDCNSGLKIHIGRVHKSVEKLRSSSTGDKSLTVSPVRVTRAIPCNNCGEDMFPTHLCEQEELISSRAPQEFICTFGEEFKTLNEME